MSLGAYIHVPFCKHKCHYCNFASGEFSSLNQEDYIQALIKEINLSATLKDNQGKVDTIFIGGGTPSYLNFDSLKLMVKFVSKAFNSFKEWTVEMNPNSISKEKLTLLKDQGVTRISMGVQSLHNNELIFLERIHDSQTALKAIDLVKELFPQSWSVDLIYGLPKQSDENWRQTLERIIEKSPSHLSLYELTYEPETPLGQQLKQKKITQLDDEKILNMQQIAQELLSSCGLERYEVSNYALPGKECLHNDLIWQGGDFLGFGSGAHGRLGNKRFRNTSSPNDYIGKLNKNQSPCLETQEDKTEEEKLMTCLLLGLRRKEGIARQQFVDLFSKDSYELWPQMNDDLSSRVIDQGGGLRCSQQGWDVLDAIISLLSERAQVNFKK